LATERLILFQYDCSSLYYAYWRTRLLTMLKFKLCSEILPIPYCIVLFHPQYWRDARVVSLQHSELPARLIYLRLA
jgi:hypothetical protein